MSETWVLNSGHRRSDLGDKMICTIQIKYQADLEGWGGILQEKWRNAKEAHGRRQA